MNTAQGQLHPLTCLDLSGLSKSGSVLIMGEQQLM